MSARVLDEHWFRAYRESPYWLRFELGGALCSIDQPAPRFIQAFLRARAVASAAFSRSSTLSAILAAPVEQAVDAFAALERLGFRASLPWRQWTATLYVGNDDVPMAWRALDINEPVMRDALLWTSIAEEMAISPHAPVMSWLIDFDTMIVLHVYDDRGMDVRALDRDSIAPLYQEFGAWLLEPERSRMAAVFG